MNRLIDVGCFNGDSTLHFAGNPVFDDIVAFDPNDSFKELWQAIEIRYPHVKFYEGAAYTSNGETEYTQRPEDAPLGSTINQSKRDWGMGRVRKVKTYDILDFIVRDTSIKLDAEGAEHDILEHIIKNDKLKYINTLYIEWHSSKMNGNYKQRQQRIEAILETERKKVVAW